MKMNPAVKMNTVADGLGRLLAACARAADRRLDALGLAPPPLELPPRVRDELREVFGDTIDPTSVMIRRGHVPGVPHPRAFALPGLIYLGADPGVVGTTSVDSAAGGTRAAGTDRPRATPTLVHELVHVWQGRFLGPGYVVAALVEQVRYGRRAYDWRAVLDRASPDPACSDPACSDRTSPDRASPDRAPQSFPVEAHAQLVSEAYARRYGFDPAALARPSRDLQVMEEALTALRAGRAPTWRGRAV